MKNAEKILKRMEYLEAMVEMNKQEIKEHEAQRERIIEDYKHNVSRMMSWLKQNEEALADKEKALEKNQEKLDLLKWVLDEEEN